MEDLKKYLQLEEGRIVNSLAKKDALGALCFISSKATYWKDLFAYKTSTSASSHTDALERFLLSRAAGGFRLYKSEANDVDTTPYVLEALKQRLYQLPCVERVQVGQEIEKKEKKRRSFLVTLKTGESLWLESDTGNSLMTDVGQFLWPILKREKRIHENEKPEAKEANNPYNIWPYSGYNEGHMVNKKGSPVDGYFKSPFKYYFYSCLLPTLFQRLRDDTEKACLKALEKRAQLTYGLNNMILVPYGYNAKRGVCRVTHTSRLKIDDRLDFTLLDFEEMVSDPALNDTKAEGPWQPGNNKCTMGSVRFLLKHQAVLLPAVPVLQKEVLGSSVPAILARSNSIIDALSKRQ